MDSQHSDLTSVGVTDDTQDALPEDSIDVQVWLNRIAKARQKEETWRNRAEKVIRIYRDDNTVSNNTYASPRPYDDNENTFNILWANTEVLLPALFSNVPKPDVRNRYLNQDKIAEKAGTIIERCLSYSLDLYDFSRRMKAAVKDVLLTGRAVVRVRLIPKFETQSNQHVDELGNVTEVHDEVMVGQEVECELVAWDSFVVDPVKRWEDVNWIAFIHMLSKDEFQKYFPGAPLIAATQTSKEPYQTETQYKVYEIWDKKAKKTFFIGQGDKPLKIMDDPLNLQGFFPIPEPLYSIQTSDTLVPIPEYTIYQSQAYELNQVSYRITDLVKACKVLGIYDSQQTNISDILKGRDSQFFPVTTNLLRQGGIKAIIDMLDISPITQALTTLYAQREQCKSVIYEVTGISDIIRGESKASETATAQSIKANYAGLRLRDRRDNINRFIVSLLRMKAELIGTFFTTKQMEEMSGIPLDFSNKPIMSLQDVEARQESEMVLQYIQNDVLRNYKIDIETDSTILADMDQQAQKSATIVASITKFISAVAPLVAQGAMPLETAKALLKFGLQAAKIPRELEDALELIGTQPANMQQMGMGMGMPQMGGMPMQQQPMPHPMIPNVPSSIPMPQNIGHGTVAGI
jgi:hypothetical protein